MRSVVLAASSALALAAIACGGAAEPTDLQGQSTSAQRSDPGNTSGTSGGSPASDECDDGGTNTCYPHSTSSSSSGGIKQSCKRDADGVLRWDPPCPQSSSNNSNGTPLVLVFDGAPVDYSAAKGATFDLFGANASVVNDWPTSKTPWLALDRDGNGRIDDGSELFGSLTRLETGVRARHGFEALAELDENHDGVVDANDPAFAKLVVWRDANDDRSSVASELTPANESVVQISLAYRNDPRCTAAGNCEIERARFVYRDARGEQRTGEVVDVHLRAH